jgi:flagellin
MFSVNTNIGALAALQSLSNTQSALQETQNQISTGKKVGSASDNPAIYQISNTMNANLAGLTAVSDSMAFGQSALKVASSAAASISSRLASLQNTVTQAQTGGIDTNTMDAQITAALTDITKFAKAATFSGVNILDGGTGSLAVVTGLDGTQLTVGNQDIVTTLGLTGLSSTSGALKFKLDQTAVNTGFDTNTLSITNQGAGTAADPTINYTFEFVKGTDTPATAPVATFDTSGNILTETKVIAVKIDEASMSTNQMTGALVTAMRGVGFGVTANTDGSLNITGNNLDNAAATTSITGGSIAAISSTTMAVDAVTNAVSSMNGIVATIGAAQQQLTGMQSFTSSLSDALTSGLGALTDADMAAESAKLQSLQTKQQLGIQALSIANQQPQALLSLFR